ALRGNCRKSRSRAEARAAPGFPRRLSYTATMADSRSDAGPTITVACAADAEYIRPLAVMLRSALRCLSAEIALTFHLAGTGIPTGDAKRLGDLCAEHRAEIHLHELNAAA